MEFSLSVKNLDGSHDKLQRFHGGYTQHFLTKTRNMAKQSFQYIHGKLIEKGRGNMCSYAKDVPDCNNQSLQHFVSNSPWNHRPVLDHIQLVTTNPYNISFQIHHGIIDQSLIIFNEMSPKLSEIKTMDQYMLMNVVFQNTMVCSF
jgi:hypothetical protein